MRIVNDVRLIDNKQWESLIQTSATSSIFQTREWYYFCTTQSVIETFVFALINDADILKGVVVGYIQKDGGKLKQYLSKRAIINGGPLLANDISRTELDALLSALVISLKRNAIYIESRNLSDYSLYKNIFCKNKFNYEEHLNFIVNTVSEEIIQSKLHKSKKRKIKSTLKENVYIEESPTVDEVKKYYQLLNRLYTTKVKTPLFPMSFFLDLYKQPFSKFLLVKKENEIIGGQVVLTLKEHTTYLFYLCGEDGKYKGIYPSVLGTYAGIQYAFKNNCHKCDMMGAGKPNEDYGVRDFKAEFGGDLVEYGRFQFISNPLLYKLGKIGVMLLKKFA